MMLVQLLLLTLLVGAAHQQKLDQPCDKGCECSRGKATCTDIKSFPTKLPRHLRYLDVINMNGALIPPGALSDLPHLEEVNILNSKISFIRPCAFSNLERVKIKIENCDINQIEAGAFRHLTDRASVTIKSSRIVRIYSFAFSDLHNLTLLEIYRCTFQTIAPLTFNNISVVEKIELSYNVFPVLPALTFRNVTEVELYQMEFNKFNGFSCNPFGRLFWNVAYTAQVLNQFPCTCEVARFLRSKYVLPAKFQESFAVENMCYTPREKFLTKLIEEQGDCKSLIEPACSEKSDSKIDLVCNRKSFKRTDHFSSIIPQATVNPTKPSTRDPNRLYTDEAEPFDPTAHKNVHSTSSGGGKNTQAADGTMKEGSASGDREGSAEGSAEGSKNKKSKVVVPSSKPDSNLNPTNRNKSGVGAVVKHTPPTTTTTTPSPSKSTKSTSLEYRNRQNRSGQVMLVSSKMVFLLSFLITIYFAIQKL